MNKSLIALILLMLGYTVPAYSIETIKTDIGYSNKNIFLNKDLDLITGEEPRSLTNNNKSNLIDSLGKAPKSRSLLDYLDSIKGEQDSVDNQRFIGSKGLSTNLYDYTPSESDYGGVMPSELDKLDDIREDAGQNIVIVYISIALIFVFLFVFLTLKQKLNEQNYLDEIDSNGGIVIRYKSLVEYLLSIPHAEISSFDKSHLSIQIKNPKSITEYIITPKANDLVTIGWVLHLQPLGHFKKTWRFSEKITNQEQMIEKINHDLEIKMKSIGLPNFNI